MTDTTSTQATSMRSHLCGELRRDHIGQTVNVCGWVGRRREHGEHLAFVDLRDHSGVLQCVINDDVDVRSEYVVRVTGVVQPNAYRQVVVTSLVGGRVTRVVPELGDVVHRGQTVIQVFSPDLAEAQTRYVSLRA